jgi:hypothetical protein
MCRDTITISEPVLGEDIHSQICATDAYLLQAKTISGMFTRQYSGGFLPIDLRDKIIYLSIVHVDECKL